MVFHSKSLLLATIILALFVLTACGDEPRMLRAERPDATSTPSKRGQGLMAAPIPLSPLDAPLFVLPETSELASLSTEAQIAVAVAPVRDLRDLAMRLDPDVDEIPAVVNAETPVYELGDEISFWVHDLDTNKNDEITAELINKTDVAYVWVEADRNHDRDSIIESTNRFSEESHPAESDFFGTEWSPGVDNDPRLHILHAADLGSGIAGYYSSADQYSRLANPFSNEKEMFYINLSWLNSSRNYNYYETVLAHEFQHMVHWHKDRNEETWLNEGLSEFAQEVAGYDPDTGFASTFASVPDTQLNTWKDSDQSNAEHYGGSYLFVAYFAQRFGPEMTRALVAHPANGAVSVDAVLAEAGLDLTFDDVFADWVVANYVDDPNAAGEDGLYGYRLFEQSAPTIEKLVETYPVKPYESTVSNLATDYLLLKGEGDVEIDFAGQTGTSLAATDPHSGNFSWWSNRGDDTDTRLTRRFDLTQISASTPITMEVAMWWEIEPDYDYGYVLASRDGIKWTPLAGSSTITDDPTGNSFGPAYNADSGSAWRMESFDLSPYAGEETLIRFEYVTDDAVNKSGWFIDDIRIPALGYANDFENGSDGWNSEGWLLTDNVLPQRWLLQVLELDENVLQAVHRYSVDADGSVRIPVNALGDSRSAVLAISGMTPYTTEPAEYRLAIEGVD